MSRKIKEVIIIPADPSPESIKNVFSVSRVSGAGWSGAETEVCRLSGTVEEKLAQYREFFGKEWAGTTESRFTIHEEVEISTAGPIFKAPHSDLIQKHPMDVEVQEKIDALTEEASRYLDENEVAKANWQELPEEERQAMIDAEMVVEA